MPVTLEIAVLISSARISNLMMSPAYTHRFRSRIIGIADTKIEVLEAGTGKTHFICTHPYFDGSGSHPAGGLTEALARAGRTFYVCPRDTASSDRESRVEKLTMSQLADDIEEVRRKLDIEKWVFVGSSTGGATALIYAIRYPEQTSGLILNCTVPSHRFMDSPATLFNPDNPLFKQLEEIELESGGGPRWVRALMIASLHNQDALQMVLDSNKISKSRLAAIYDELAVRKWDVEPFLKDIRAPTLVIAGRFDVPVGTLDPSFTILRNIVGSEYAIMNNSGHYPYDEEPTRFREVVQDFTTRRLDVLA